MSYHSPSKALLRSIPCYFSRNDRIALTTITEVWQIATFIFDTPNKLIYQLFQGQLYWKQHQNTFSEHQNVELQSLQWRSRKDFRTSSYTLGYCNLLLAVLYLCPECRRVEPSLLSLDPCFPVAFELGFESHYINPPQQCATLLQAPYLTTIFSISLLLLIKTCLSIYLLAYYHIKDRWRLLQGKRQ